MKLCAILQRLCLLAFAASMLLSVPLFKAYGYGTNKDKVRVAPLPYFLHGLEQLDFVKKSKTFRGMAKDIGTWLHIPMVIADDYAIPQYLEKQIGYKSIWKHKRQESSKTNKKSKKNKKKEKERRKEEEDRRKGTITQRASQWRDGLNGIKEMAKGDLVGVLSGAVLIITSLLAVLIPSVAQAVFISLLGMQVGVSRRNLPGGGVINTFYYVMGLLIAVFILDYFIPDLEKLKKSKEASEEQKKRKMEKKRAKREKEKNI
jgi:hypothetical protein